MKLLNDLSALMKQLYDHFGYGQEWTVFPLDDQTECYWMLVGGDKDTGEGASCVYSEEPFTTRSLEEGKKICSGPVYTNRHLPRWVWRALEETMVLVDTQCDGNKLLMIFTNARECVDLDLKQVYADYWGSGSV